MAAQGVLDVALFGECMLELQDLARPGPGQGFGPMQLGYGGDTLNTAVYLSRCAGACVRARYATGLGEDRFSAMLLRSWAEEGVETDLVRRVPGRMPGIYAIQLDDSGERSFSYWRDASAAKAYFDTAITPLEAQAGELDALYLSGISLAILDPASRERLFGLMAALRRRGAAVVFDNNYRPRLWSSVDEARAVFRRAFDEASIALVTADDHLGLFGFATLQEAVSAAQDLACGEVVIKRGAGSTLVRASADAAWAEAPTERVEAPVDTTAAGDSFAGGYLARRLLGASAVDAARFGNQVAARVIRHRGALIPRAEMLDLMPEPRPAAPAAVRCGP